MTANCATTGPSTLTVTVSSGQISRVRFEVSCVAVAEGVLLFTWNRLDGQHLYRIGLDGTGLADLTPSHPACCGDWSPDGSRIVYGDPAGFTVMNQDGGDPTSIGLGGSSPRWSPDGTKLVYTSSTAATSTIYVANADGSGARALGPGLAPDWSPDGRRIAFYGDETCNVVMCGADVFTMDSDGTHVQRLTHSSGGFEFYGYPAWSPDGSRLAVRYRAFLFGDRIEIISLQGVVRVRLAGTGGRGGPVWSPDGSAIAFAGYGDSTGTPYITIVPSAGGTPVVLAGTPANAHPTSWK
jgi:Tol biopolymer transport system component